jgi:hypothetical protein
MDAAGIDRPGIRGIAAVFLSAALFLPPAAGAPDAGGFCATGPEPQVVFSCLEKAYADRDLNEYRRVFADNFVYEVAGGASSGLSEELASAERLFCSPEVKKMTLVIPPGYTITHADEPDTWVIQGVLVKLLVESEQDGRTDLYEVTMTDSEFAVRWFERPQPHYAISLWYYDPGKDAGRTQ